MQIFILTIFPEMFQGPFNCGLFQKAIATLFEEVKDPIDVIKRKEIIETLEAATDKAEDVANVLESIIVKNT